MNRKLKACQDCNHCVYICEGDYICDFDEPVLILEDFTPTDDYMYCGGKDWESDDNDE